MSSKNRSPGTMLTRRNALKAGAGAGAAAFGLSGVGVPDKLEVAEDAEAGLLLTGAIGMAGYMATSYALRRLDIIGPDDVPDGLGPETLQLQVYNAVKKRRSVNKSTIADNRNLIGYLPETAFSDAKLAALDKIKNGGTKDEATTAGKKAANAHFTTIEKNLLRSWNETAREVGNLVNAVQDHDNLSTDGVIWNPDNSTAWWDPVNRTHTAQLRDGSTFDTVAVVTEYTYSGSYDHPYLPFINEDWWDGRNSLYWGHRAKSPDGATVDFIQHDDWVGLWDDFQTEFDNILDNITLWVDNTYDQIQTGEISPGEYLSGVDIANSLAEDDNRATAIGDLLAMNIPGDYDHESTIQLEDDNAKTVGFLAYTGDDSVPTLNAGITIDPSNYTGTWYLAYRPGTYIMEWTAYDDTYGIQGGEARFTSDPTTDSDGIDLTGEVAYEITTTHEETATVVPADFTESTDDSGNTIWVVDLTDQLEQTITDIAKVRRVYVGENPDTYTSVVLDQAATILDIEGTDSLTIEQHREPQDDTNYITEEEWQTILDQQQELIEKYEDASSSAGGGWSPSFDVPTWGPLDSIEDWGLAAIAAVIGSAVFGNLN